MSATKHARARAASRLRSAGWAWSRIADQLGFVDSSHARRTVLADQAREEEIMTGERLAARLIKKDRTS